MAGRILIIDDDASYNRALARNLVRSEHDVTTCGTAAEARSTLSEVVVDVIVLDYQLPDADGLALLDELRPIAEGAVFVMATAYPDLDVAVEAIRRGAFDYVAKDADLKECLLRIERGVEVAVLRRRMAEVSREGNEGTQAASRLIGDSSSMQSLRQRLGALAGADDTTVLITGETGTGKGVVAREIHSRSSRAYEPFVAVDCTTIPATLVESELFGHVKGAFSGASATTTGRVEAAGRGTLFLDEIGELELPIQAKLLRLLEEREFTRVGDTRARKVDARIIAATNRDLERAVAEGRFRADLRYRLEVFVVDVPPLRERGDDAFLLIAHFVYERARALGRTEPRLHPKVIEWLPRYPFPGNIRELRNMVEQAVLLSEGDQLTLDDFPVLRRLASGSVGGAMAANAASAAETRADDPPAVRATGSERGKPEDPPGAETAARSEAVSAAPQVDPGADLKDIRQRAAERERRSLLEALERTGGNVSAAARQLGVSRYALLRRLRRHGLR